MRGQMYDCYLDPNACLFGLRKGSEAIHIMCNPATKMVMIVNNTFDQLNDLMQTATFYDYEGNSTDLAAEIDYIEASSARKFITLQKSLGGMLKDDGGFLHLQLFDKDGELLSDNLYWYPNEKGEYSGLNKMKKANTKVSSKVLAPGKMEVTISNPEGGPVAFFNRVALTDPKTGERILPAFYSDNYLSVVPGGTKTITVEYPGYSGGTPKVTVLGWN